MIKIIKKLFGGLTEKDLLLSQLDDALTHYEFAKEKGQGIMADFHLRIADEIAKKIKNLEQ